MSYDIKTPHAGAEGILPQMKGNEKTIRKEKSSPVMSMASERTTLLSGNDKSSKNCKGCVLTLRFISNFFNAVVCLPITAGNYVGNQRFRDGRVASLVTLLTITAVFTSVLFLKCGSSTMERMEIKVDIVQISTSGLLIASILIYFMLLSTYRIISVKDVHKRSHLFVKIAFVVFFTPCNILHVSSHICIYFSCRDLQDKSVNVHIVYRVLLLVFVFLQMIFILLFSGKSLLNSCIINFSGAVVLVTNISTACYHLLAEHFEGFVHENITDCKNYSKAYRVHERLKPYLDPTMVENSLLAILILKELYDTVEKNVLPANPDDHLNSCMVDNSLNSTRNVFTKALLSALLGILMSVPYFVFEIHRPFQFAIYMFIVKFLTYLALIYCFILIQPNYFQKVKSVKTRLNLNHYLILISGFGSTVYFCLNVIAAFYEGSFVYLPNAVFEVVTTFLQSVLILQMKDHENMNKEEKKIVLSILFMFLSFINFGIWSYDTFFPKVYTYVSYATKFYGYNVMVKVRHVLVPILIFYRFKCFLSFLELSNVGRKELNAASKNACQYFKACTKKVFKKTNRMYRLYNKSGSL